MTSLEQMSLGASLKAPTAMWGGAIFTTLQNVALKPTHVIVRCSEVIPYTWHIWQSF